MSSPSGPPSRFSPSEPPDHKHSPVTCLATPSFFSASIKNNKIPDPECQYGSISFLHLTTSDLPGTDSQSLSCTYKKYLSLSYLCLPRQIILVVVVGILVVANAHFLPTRNSLCAISTYTQWLCYAPPLLRPLPQQRSLLLAPMALT